MSPQFLRRLINSRLIVVDDQIMRPTTATGTLIERRKGYRQPVQCVGRIRAVGSQEWIEVFAFDISMHGIGLSCERPFLADVTMELDLPDYRHLGPFIQVRYCRRRTDGMYDLGCRFAGAGG